MDLCKTGDELAHLEWAEHSEELVKHVSTANFLASIPPTQPASSASQHMESIETGNASLDAVMALASSSPYYKYVGMDKIQAMKPWSHRSPREKGLSYMQTLQTEAPVPGISIWSF